jgi:hypothetical protein
MRLSVLCGRRRKYFAVLAIAAFNREVREDSAKDAKRTSYFRF